MSVIYYNIKNRVVAVREALQHRNAQPPGTTNKKDEHG